MNVRYLTAVLLLLLCSGCGTAQVLGNAEPVTTGERFRQELAKIDAVCRERKLGPYLDPLDPQFRSKRAITDCEILRVKAFDLSAILATEEGRFAYSITLPPPHDRAQVAYKSSMSAEQYFQALCEREAGDFAFKIVSEVDRIRQLRSNPPARSTSLATYSEEGLGGLFLAVGIGPAGYLVAPAMHKYDYLEAPNPRRKGASAADLVEYFRDPSAQQSYPDYGVSSRPLTKSLARYGYLWRGVERQHARELGILGGELIVMDLKTNEILGLRREFALYAVLDSSKGKPWFSAKNCRRHQETGYSFLATVVKPIGR